MALYQASPKNIERISDIFKKMDYAELSLNPEVLDKQLDLLENISEYCKYRADFLLCYICSRFDTSEDLDAKFEVWENFKKDLKSLSLFKKFKKDNILSNAINTLEGTNNTSKNIILMSLSNKKYKDLIGVFARHINGNNVALIEDIIKNDKYENPDTQGFCSLVDATKLEEYPNTFIRENIDKLSLEDLGCIAGRVNRSNGNLTIRLYTDKELNFPKDKIPSIINMCDESNIELITRLCTDKELNFPVEQIENIAKTTLLGNVKLVEKLCTSTSPKCPPEKIPAILDVIDELETTEVENLLLGRKIAILDILTSLDGDTLDLCRQYSSVDIDAKIAELTSLLNKKKDVITIPQEKQQMFIQDVISNNNQKTEDVLKNFDFGQYEKNGLPLKYTRKEFNSNIENLLKDLTPQEQNILLSHFGLIRGSAGFDGLPNNVEYTDLNSSPQVLEVAKKIKLEIEKFTSENKVVTGNSDVDEILTSLISGLPEFTSIVGKEQHGTHAYSVDIHTLKVLQSAMNNPLYETLSDRDKTVLKISALCHDLGKRGGVVDDGHATVSAEYVAAILNKFSFPQGMKDRIIDIVNNHHWFAAFNSGNIDAQDVAIRCRRPEDFVIYELLAKADLENVNDTFHFEKTNGTKNQVEFNQYMQNKMQAIDDVLIQMYSNANLVFDTQFVQNGNKFPTQTIKINNKPTELKVLDLNKISNNASLEQYGFSRGVTKKSARFTVHMTTPNKGNLESVLILTKNTLNQSTWSTSLIKASNNQTYADQKFGFIFDVDQANVSEAYYQNLGSGGRKDINSFKYFSFYGKSKSHSFIKQHLLEELSKKGINLDDNEYAILVKFLMSKKYTTQITQDVKIGNKVIKANDLVESLEQAREFLFKGGYGHNEIVSINPRIKGLIAKVEKLKDCPEEFLAFAKEHDLPIILMKPKE
jgi:hypothetical protein